MKKLPKPTAEEIAAACEAFCQAADADPQFFRGYRHKIPLLRTEMATNKIPRRRLGRLLINRYRRATGDLKPIKVGGPRWDAFVAWIREHAAEINFARLIVSILMLLLIL